MNKKVKSVSMLLLIGGLSSGVAYAEQPKDKSEFDIVQQNATCQGIVKDATGETVIGASVIVQGTTNGTITDMVPFVVPCTITEAPITVSPVASFTIP